MELDYQDSKVCQQCAALAESLAECGGGCGRELCSYCAPKCHECSDREKIEQIEQEEREEKRSKREAEKKGFQPERTAGEKVGRALDWLTGLSDGVLRRELEHYEGEFDMYDSDVVQEMMKERWKTLPDWKKKMYKAKKKSEMFVAKTAYKTIVDGGRMIGHLGRPMTEKEIEWENEKHTLEEKEEDFPYETEPTDEENNEEEDTEEESEDEEEEDLKD